MNILNIEHIDKIFGEKKLFENASLGISMADKIGIVGINGTGKTTLLKLAAGMENPDKGQVIRQNGIRISYLAQESDFPEGATVASYALSGVAEMDWLVQSNLNQLGITEYDKPIGQLSGGQKKRVVMAKVLADETDILLLDEPTNHLDSEMIDWLEDYLKNFRGTILMVTHDRYFLDKVANRIVEISGGNIYAYESDYSGFLKLKMQREEMEAASERKRQSVLRMEVEWAKRGCRARSTKQKARLERLEQLKNGGLQASETLLDMDSVETRMGRKTVELNQISKAYGEKVLLERFDYIFLKNQRIAFIGPNGCGKSTLLKMIIGLIEPDSGTIEIGDTIKIGYFAQEVPNMDSNQRVIEYVREIAEYIPTRDGRITASQMLERFLFTPDMQYSQVSKLSGGEKKRLYLLGILQSAPNFLILDEASNDIDIPTITILEDYLTSFAGIVLTVSHDRYFLDNVTDRIFEFDGRGKLIQYEGGYTDYLEAREQRKGAEQQNESLQKTVSGQINADSAKSWKINSPVKLKFSYKEQKEYETINEDISSLEECVERLEEEMLANATNSAKLSEIMEAKEKKEQELEEKMERWLYLSDLGEQIESQK